MYNWLEHFFVYSTALFVSIVDLPVVGGIIVKCLTEHLDFWMVSCPDDSFLFANEPSLQSRISFTGNVFSVYLNFFPPIHWIWHFIAGTIFLFISESPAQGFTVTSRFFKFLLGLVLRIDCPTRDKYWQFSFIRLVQICGSKYVWLVCCWIDPASSYRCFS